MRPGADAWPHVVRPTTARRENESAAARVQDDSQLAAVFMLIAVLEGFEY